MNTQVKSYTGFIILFFLAYFPTGCKQGDSVVRSAVETQLSRYPATTLVDIYKSFFQDEFGPGHLLGDTTGAREYLQWELSEMTSRGNYRTEPCGMGKNFYRVPLDLVKDGIIHENEYFAAFIASASSFRTPEAKAWKEKWERIVKEIEAMDLGIPNFDNDKATLADMLERGESVVHHSERYGELYHPHYRIFGKEQVELLKGSIPGQ